MKRIVAMLLIGLLVAPPASAGQKPGKPIKWQKVQTLKVGTEIGLTGTGGQPTKVRLLFADEAVLVTLKPGAPKLPGQVMEFLFGLGPRWPAILNAGLRCESGHHRLSGGEIFDGDKKLADLVDVVQSTARVEMPKSRKPHTGIGGARWRSAWWLSSSLLGSSHRQPSALLGA